MRSNLKVLFCLLFIAFFSAIAHSQEKRVATAVRIQGESPRIDGLVDDEAWQTVEWQNNFVQHQPLDGEAPSEQTEFKIIYDNNSIFIAIRAWETNPDSIVRLLSRRDSGDGDGVGIEFDSYNDHQTAFSFVVLASGVKIDKLFTNDGAHEDYSWDAIWDAKTSIDTKGWIAEIEIPLNQLRFNSKDQQVWGLQVGRYIYRKNELSLWQPIPRDAPGWVHQFGVLKGISGIKPKRQVEIAPYILGQVETFEKEHGNPFATGFRNRFSGGIDAKIGVTNDITLDLTVFPDFGQVEADPSEVNLTAFETYFAEKRPFFIEGRNLFDFQFSPGNGSNSAENLFYSRRIGRQPRGYPDTNETDFVEVPENSTILGAAKVTSKSSSGLSFGFMDAVTSREYSRIDSNGQLRLEEVEPLTSYLVGSAIKDFNQGDTRIGVMATSTNREIRNETLNFLHSDAFSGGVTILHKWNNKNYSANFKSYFSHVAGSTNAIVTTQTSSARYFQRTDATHISVDSSRTSLTGHGGLLSIGKEGDGHWRYVGFVSWKSPELEVNDIGFVRSVDEVSQVLWVGYRYWTPFSIFREINVDFNQWTGYNFAGELSYFGGELNVQGQLKNYWYVGGGTSLQGKSISYSALRGGPSLALPGGISGWAWITTDNRKKVTLSASSSLFRGEVSLSQSISANINYKPNNGLMVSIGPSYSYSERKLQYVNNIEWENNVSYVNASMNQSVFNFQVRVNYSVTPDLSIQFYGRPFFAKGQYYDFKQITDPRATKFTDRFETFSANQLSYDDINSEYLIDENGNGDIDYSFCNPNFNVRSFQSNFVVRWEYRPGSTLFFVWAQGRDSFESDYFTTLGYSANELYSAYPHNVLLVKLAYRFY